MELRNKQTGERGILALNNSEGEIEIVVLEPDMPLCGNSVLARYDSLAELNEEWEDYAPKEPLIKDKKVRKAVRAWAEANRIDANDKMLEYDEAENRLIWIATFIDFNEDECLDNLKDGKTYSITELCGEEENE